MTAATPPATAPSTRHTQREVWYGTAAEAEAAARDFQRRGYRRRTRGLAPGDVLVAESEKGFSVRWVPQAAPSTGKASRTRRRPRQ